MLSVMLSSQRPHLLARPALQHQAAAQEGRQGGSCWRSGGSYLHLCPLHALLLPCPLQSLVLPPTPLEFALQHEAAAQEAADREAVLAVQLESLRREATETATQLQQAQSDLMAACVAKDSAQRVEAEARAAKAAAEQQRDVTVAEARALEERLRAQVWGAMGSRGGNGGRQETADAVKKREAGQRCSHHFTTVSVRPGLSPSPASEQLLPHI